MAKTAFPTSIDDLHHNFSPENQTNPEQSIKDFEHGLANYGSYPGNSMMFPKDLEANDEYFVMFSPFEYSRANRSEIAKKTNVNSVTGSGKFKGHIILPLPADLSTGYGANYSQEELGISGLAVAAATDAVKNIWNDVKGSSDFAEARKSVSSEIQSIAKAGEENAAGALASGALAVDDFFTSGAALALGRQRNPHLAVLFQGVGFRQHRFSYKFTAKNQEESLILYSIIKTFKAAMHPSYVTGYSNHLFKYPDEWDITFAHPQFKIGPSVLLDFQINYHGQGVPSYFRDHQPTTVSMNLLFQETSIVTKEDVLERER